MTQISDKILIIEDDRHIAHFISMALKTSGYQPVIAATGEAGIRLFCTEAPRLVLLDLGLPDRDGIDVVRDLRSASQVPILIVSARGQEQEKIGALDAGADDYITKPFHMGELLARIRAAERRWGKTKQPAAPALFEADYLTVDYEKRKVLIDNQEIHLTPIEYKLLTLLIANAGKVLTHNYILKEVWGYEETGDTQSIRVYMASLRRKIEKNTAKPRFILTEVGIGYRFADE